MESKDDLDPTLLDAEAESRTPGAPLRTEVADDEAADAALARAYQQRYRPAHNPGRLSLAARVLFANAGGEDRTGGRLGGAQVDVGQSWNHIGYAVTVSAWGGRVFLRRETGTEMNAMFGAGPTLNLGRLALLGSGYLDVRAGYDFLYGVVNERRDNAAVVQPQGDPQAAQLTQAENLLPHGPRLQMNMGLLVDNRDRRFIHGFGVSAGYQALVHSFRGDLPFTHMLTLGLSYWMG